MHKIPIEVVSLESNGFHLLIDVVLNNKTFKMVLDTGASKTVFDLSGIQEIGFKNLNISETNVLSSGLGTNDMKSYEVKLPKLQIGTWEVKNFEAALLDLSSIHFAYEQLNLPKIIGVLGGDVLVQYKGIINYKNQTLTLNNRKSSVSF